jgi:ADP-ribosylglycohydrolase
MGNNISVEESSDTSEALSSCLGVLGDRKATLEEKRAAFDKIQTVIAPVISDTPAYAEELQRVFGLRYEPWGGGHGHGSRQQDQVSGGGRVENKVVAKADRVRGLLFGAALGDAVGLATEFMSKQEVAAKYPSGIHTFHPSANVFPDTHRMSFAKGDWTDDTDQLLLILQTLLEHKGKYHGPTFAKKLRAWRENGFQELGDQGGAGMGRSTKMVLEKKGFLENPEKAALEFWISTGRKMAPNGAVMRTAVTALAAGCWDDCDDSRQQKDDDDIVEGESVTRCSAALYAAEAVEEATLGFCRSTHADPRCQASCIVVAECARQVLQLSLESAPQGVHQSPLHPSSSSSSTTRSSTASSPPLSSSSSSSLPPSALPSPLLPPQSPCPGLLSPAVVEAIIEAAVVRAEAVLVDAHQRLDPSVLTSEAGAGAAAPPPPPAAASASSSSSPQSETRRETSAQILAHLDSEDLRSFVFGLKKSRSNIPYAEAGPSSSPPSTTASPPPLTPPPPSSSLAAAAAAVASSPALPPAPTLRDPTTPTLQDLELDDGPSIGFTFKCLAVGVWALRRAALVPSKAKAAAHLKAAAAAAAAAASTTAEEKDGVEEEKETPMAAALFVLECERSEVAEILDEVVRAGGDADTNGAVAGALVGAALGFSRLPQKWCAELPYGAWLEAWAQKLLWAHGLPCRMDTATGIPKPPVKPACRSVPLQAS